MRDLNGDIDIISPVDTEKGTGTRVVIRFPKFQGEAVANNNELEEDAKLQQSV